MKTSQKIHDYIQKNQQATGKELADHLPDITPRAVRKQLKNLLDNEVLYKIGKPPKVFYLLKQPTAKTTAIGKKSYAVSPSIKKTVEKRFFYISPTGKQIEGWEGFVAWCTKNHQEPVKTALEYTKTLAKYDAFSQNGVIDGMSKLRSTFDEVYLDKLFYLDFYSIERFGKTRLGQMLLYAKQSQNKNLIKSLILEIQPAIERLIAKYDIDGLVFVPPTVKREVQLMKELEKQLQLPVAKLIVTKVKTDIPVPQKTLSKLTDRVENARYTIVVEDNKKYQNILIIDDAVGSGATINQTAAQIRQKKLCAGKIVGLAITGSYKGFDVISEV